MEGQESANESTQIDQLVKKEIRRRKRLFWTYSSMLLIPLVTGVLFLAFGRSDRVMVSDEIDAKVKPVQATLDETLPAVQQIRKAAATLDEQQNRIQSLQQNQEEISRKIRPLSDQLASLQQNAVTAATLDNRLENVNGSLSSYNQRVAALAQQQSQIQADQVKIRQNIDQVSQTLAVVKRSQDDSFRTVFKRMDTLENQWQMYYKRDQPTTGTAPHSFVKKEPESGSTRP
jgi:predicted  nucleic acid-binding Zn-ribbon protein